ncbi:MAG: hypothetical protein NTW08_03780 [Gammaproteobacteria bacterium]|nr:hypothetical protein [Gammaproteobacteria bacterium]
MSANKTNLSTDSEWCFKESARQRGCYAKLDEAEGLMDEGELEQAMTILENIVEKFPDCLEIYNDIYLCHFYKGQYQRAFKYLKGVVHNIVSALPENFLSRPKQKFSIRGMGWVSKQECIDLAKQGQLDVVVCITAIGQSYIRGRANSSINPCLKKLVIKKPRKEQ